jgi:hypothetical protein
MPERAASGTLELRREAKVADLVGDGHHDRFEASGVVAVDDLLYVIFDSSSEIGVLGARLSRGDSDNRLIPDRLPKDVGYEDIVHDRSTRRFLALVEAVPADHGFMARVDEYDESFDYLASAWLPFPLPTINKGLEGLTCVNRAGRAYLLGLCEGNLCLAGAAGRRPGGGRIQVFERSAQAWDHVDTLRLPASLWFEDFSSVALTGDRLCVISQESSALWVGRLAPSAWQVLGEGTVYRFPRNDDGKTIYCNLEGVSWLSADEVVVVSDKMKQGEQKPRCRSKDQSIHVFAVP